MSADRVLIDTSVWIEYFKGADSALTQAVEALIKGGSVYTAGIILAELLQGARSDREMRVIEDIKESFPLLTSDREGEAWLEAGRLSRELRKAGTTVHLADCLIAVLARENQCRIATRDVHFQAIKERTAIDLIPFQ
jgi:predicted nucleic acid-binding protein